MELFIVYPCHVRSHLSLSLQNKIVKQADKITNSTPNRKVAEKPTQMIYE
jgi:hypothetical protein